MNKTLLLLFGGESSEHEVSINSARTIYQAIAKDAYSVLLGYITAKGEWFLLDEWHDEPQSAEGAPIVLLPGSGQMFVNGAVQAVDIIFPVLHGKNGEDGNIQGLAASMHIPIVGCGILSSAICMDKRYTKQIIKAAGYSVARGVNAESTYGAEKTAATLLGAHPQTGDPYLESQIGTPPWFVKPSRNGSSVGVSKVEKTEELERALRAAMEYDSSVLIEEGIVGRELEVAVLGSGEAARVSGVGEIIPGEVFYSYEDKYSSDTKSKAVIPADIPQPIRLKIQEWALQSYMALGCEGLARVDFFLTDDERLYINEVNTMPGFTNNSMYPKLWEHEGMDISELVGILIEDAYNHV